MMVNTALYFMSDTTIWHYIVPDIKEEILIYCNPLSNLFCTVGCANSLTNAFSGNSSLTKNSHEQKQRPFAARSIWQCSRRTTITEYSTALLKTLSLRQAQISYIVFDTIQSHPQASHLPAVLLKFRPPSMHLNLNCKNQLNQHITKMHHSENQDLQTKIKT